VCHPLITTVKIQDYLAFHGYVDGDRPRFLKKRLNSPIHRRDGHGIAAMDHQCVPGLLLPALRL
jgi:hypothetical protein